MPEFKMPLGDNRVQIADAPFQGATLAFENLDEFTQGYIEAMFFTDASDPDDGDLQDATFADLAPVTLAEIMADCERFQTTNAALLDSVYGVIGKYEKSPYSAQRAGNDYWYTRNGHGTGFWDRGLGDVGDQLAAAARYSSVDLYKGDDGKLYLM